MMFNNPFPEEDVEFLPMISIEEEVVETPEQKQKAEQSDEVPILPLRNTVLFPGVVLPITVGRDKSIKAVKEAYKTNRIIGVIAQKDSSIEDPEKKDLNEIGTIARIIKLLKIPDGSTTVIIQGRQRFRVKEILSEDPFMRAKIEQLKDIPPKDQKEFAAITASIKDLAGQIIKLSPNIPSEASIMLKNIDNSTFLMHFISSNLNTELSEKQKILEVDDLAERANLVLKHLNTELQLLELKNKIQTKVRTDIEKQQREYFLHQQIKTMQEELGAEGPGQEVKRLREKAKEKKWSKEVGELFEREVTKLERMNINAAEYSVQLNYLELLLELPWGIYTDDKIDLKKTKEVLDRDHYGLEKVKERILEYLAVLKLKGDMKSPILCFVGPPGVGKTSLGRSIANAIGRKFVRMSLGGLHDESEIRGHRKTYIGAMPGRIIQSIKKVKTSNPVFMLDEIDKVGTDFRGDPSSALLEVLDPEQNSKFYDNYLELEYDLSKVLFIATANSMNTVQPALRDRMEVIEISGYSTEEKIEIAKRHLIPKQREAHGLNGRQIRIPEKTIEFIIENYTRESGVRELERKIAGVMRSIAKEIAMEKNYETSVSIEDVRRILGPETFDKDIYQEDQPPGVAIGLAWTYTGGDILFIETSLSKGKGELTLTGNLGNVMKESATTALSFIKSHAEELGINPEVFETTNVHIHVPEGAIPKDGPSAGITMMASLASAFTGRKLKPYFALTGEITLRGKVLPVGGIKEKILAAKRAGLKNIVLCKANKKNVDEINKEYVQGLSFHYVDTMMEVLDLVLERKPVKRVAKVPQVS
ncbi:MAG TPA: endopeptidase La [Chitinophagales bacterium]|nr:endopeptidase La [Chitinophagales bacterium]